MSTAAKRQDAALQAQRKRVFYDQVVNLDTPDSDLIIAKKRRLATETRKQIPSVMQQTLQDQKTLLEGSEPAIVGDKAPLLGNMSGGLSMEDFLRRVSKQTGASASMLKQNPRVIALYNALKSAPEGAKAGLQFVSQEGPNFKIQNNSQSVMPMALDPLPQPNVRYEQVTINGKTILIPVSTNYDGKIGFRGFDMLQPNATVPIYDNLRIVQRESDVSRANAAAVRYEKSLGAKMDYAGVARSNPVSIMDPYIPMLPYLSMTEGKIVVVTTMSMTGCIMMKDNNLGNYEGKATREIELFTTSPNARDYATRMLGYKPGNVHFVADKGRMDVSELYKVVEASDNDSFALVDMAGVSDLAVVQIVAKLAAGKFIPKYIYVVTSGSAGLHNANTTKWNKMVTELADEINPMQPGQEVQPKTVGEDEGEGEGEVGRGLLVKGGMLPHEKMLEIAENEKSWNVRLPGFYNRGGAVTYAKDTTLARLHPYVAVGRMLPPSRRSSLNGVQFDNFITDVYTQALTTLKEDDANLVDNIVNRKAQIMIPAGVYKVVRDPNGYRPFYELLFFIGAYFNEKNSAAPATTYPTIEKLKEAAKKYEELTRNRLVPRQKAEKGPEAQDNGGEGGEGGDDSGNGADDGKGGEGQKQGDEGQGQGGDDDAGPEDQPSQPPQPPQQPEPNVLPQRGSIPRPGLQEVPPQPQAPIEDAAELQVVEKELNRDGPIDNISPITQASGKYVYVVTLSPYARKAPVPPRQQGVGSRIAAMPDERAQLGQEEFRMRLAVNQSMVDELSKLQDKLDDVKIRRAKNEPGDPDPQVSPIANRTVHES